MRLVVGQMTWPTLIFLAITFSPCVAVEPPAINNIILMILDGVGYNQYELTRVVYGDLNVDDMYHLGAMTTYSANAEITESPAAATALATGHKTNNVMAAMAPDEQHLTTVLEFARDRGMRTGLITTVMIYDATPAAFAAHNESRYNYSQIAAEMLEAGVDVLLGGGRAVFADGGLLPRAHELGYAYVTDRPQLMRITNNRMLGLFSDIGMSYELDRHWTDEPSIAEMTEKAIEVLSSDSDVGFFLMVEGGKTDWAGHRNDPASIAGDLHAFDEALGVALQFAQEDGHTLVVVTSDHETGGLSFRDADRDHIASFLGQITASAECMSNCLDDRRTNVEQCITQYSPVDELTSTEVRAIQDCGSGFSGWRLEPDSTISDVLSSYARTDFTSNYHTSADVPLFWYGRGAFEYTGACDNTDVGRELIAIVTKSGAWSNSTISWDETEQYDGMSASVAGEVVGSDRHDGMTYINLGNPYPAEELFTVVIPTECEQAFVARFGERPAGFFTGAWIVAHGEVALDDEGRLYMWMCDPYSIRIVERQSQ